MDTSIVSFCPYDYPSGLFSKYLLKVYNFKTIFKIQKKYLRNIFLMPNSNFVLSHISVITFKLSLSFIGTWQT